MFVKLENFVSRTDSMHTWYPFCIHINIVKNDARLGHCMHFSFNF